METQVRGLYAQLRAEYDMTIRVLAVVVEQLLLLTGDDELQVTDQAVTDQPDLTAWRNESDHCISLRTSR
jgi:hypothetical protein